MQLKANLHKMVDRIEDERLLNAIHSFLRQPEHAEEGKMWKELTEKQKQEVLKAYDESEDDSNLISDDKVWNSVKIKGNQITILTFFDVRQDPKKRLR